MTDWISGSFNVTSKTEKRDSEEVALEKIKRTSLQKTVKTSRCRALACCLMVPMYAHHHSPMFFIHNYDPLIVEMKCC